MLQSAFFCFTIAQLDNRILVLLKSIKFYTIRNMAIYSFGIFHKTYPGHKIPGMGNREIRSYTYIKQYHLRIMIEETSFCTSYNYLSTSLLNPKRKKSNTRIMPLHYTVLINDTGYHDTSSICNIALHFCIRNESYCKQSRDSASHSIILLGALGRRYSGRKYYLNYRADSSFAPGQWETALLCNDVARWLGASLESALNFIPIYL